ncbi:MAG TPA: hypothetical protein VGD91_17110 [Trebonia sp.]
MAQDDIAEIAATLTRVTGRTVTYEPETIEQAYANRRPFSDSQWQLDAWMSTYTAIAAGGLSGSRQQHRAGGAHVVPPDHVRHYVVRFRGNAPAPGRRPRGSGMGPRPPSGSKPGVNACQFGTDRHPAQLDNPWLPGVTVVGTATRR